MEADRTHKVIRKSGSSQAYCLAYCDGFIVATNSMISRVPWPKPAPEPPHTFPGQLHSGRWSAAMRYICDTPGPQLSTSCSPHWQRLNSIGRPVALSARDMLPYIS